MNEIIKVTYKDDGSPTVSGRELHEALEIGTKYADWFKRMCEYGFVENEDYVRFSNLGSETQHGGQNKTDHALTIPMAKELCMLQRTDKGREIRKYFIAVEEQWNSPEAIMARALKLANVQLKALQVTVSELTVENQIMKPKADYFDDLVDRNLLTGIRETAKELKLKQTVFVNFLLEKKYLYRDQKGKLMPYQKHVDGGLFELKESTNQKTGWGGTQTMITPKGKETFRLLCIA